MLTYGHKRNRWLCLREFTCNFYRKSVNVIVVRRIDTVFKSTLKKQRWNFSGKMWMKLHKKKKTNGNKKEKLIRALESRNLTRKKRWFSFSLMTEYDVIGERTAVKPMCHDPQWLITPIDSQLNSIEIKISLWFSLFITRTHTRTPFASVFTFALVILSSVSASYAITKFFLLSFNAFVYTYFIMLLHCSFVCRIFRYVKKPMQFQWNTEQCCFDFSKKKKKQNHEIPQNSI